MLQKPVSEWNVKTVTVCLNDWAQSYLDVAKVRFVPTSYREKRSMFKRFFAEISPALPVANLKAGDVMGYIIKQMEVRKSGYAANKDRKNLVAAWNWGMKYMNPPLPGPNPCLVETMPEVRHPRYVPSEEDFWKVVDAAEGQDKVMLLAFLFLAARRKEIFRLTWSDIDFSYKRVRLWTRKRADGSEEFDWLPMTTELRKELRWWWENRPIKDADHVFLCLEEGENQKKHYGKPFRYRHHFMERLCGAAKVKVFGFHAIRHLTASILFRHGYELGAIQVILRHQSPSTTERYLKRIGLERVREVLEDLSRSKKGEVVPFKHWPQKIALPGLQE
jgi:integrase